ncbi:MAG: alpha/beta hydrolase [Planctomycetota bacterium]|nr:alpha/beta hydrolase [Planctomycetota bacterium]
MSDLIHHESETPQAPPQRPPCPTPASLLNALADFNAKADVKIVKTPYYNTTCRILGDGPTLIVSPGVASTYEGFTLFLNTLAQQFRTIIYDYPGEQPNDQSRLSKIHHNHLVQNLFEVMDSLSIGRAFLVGTSFGSTITLKALANDPRRFPKAAVQGGFARRKFSPAERIGLNLGRFFPGSVGNLPLHRPILTYNNRIHFPSEIDDRWQHYVEQNARTPINSMAHRLNIMSKLDLRPILPTIETPVLLIQGNEDRIVRRSNYDELQTGLKNSQGIVLPLVGHQPHYTHPEALAHLIANYFLGCQEHTQCPSHSSSQ